jgi:predicted nucleotidyltransferase
VTHPDPQSLIDRFVEVCLLDDRIVAAFLGGSLAREQADTFSDVDLCVITRDDAFDDVVAERASLIERLGEPVFVEDWGTNDVVSFVLADGTEAEIFFGREGALDELWPGQHRTLFDRDGILEGFTFEEERTEPGELEDVLRQTLSWFWHELSHFVKAVGRNQLWWAAGQLEALRGHCVKLVRIERGAQAGEEPYWKLDEEIRTSGLEPLQATFVPMDRSELLRAGRALVAFFRERAPRVAEAYGLTYPVELDRVMVNRLDELAGDSD